MGSWPGEKNHPAERETHEAAASETGSWFFTQRREAAKIVGRGRMASVPFK